MPQQLPGRLKINGLTQRRRGDTPRGRGQQNPFHGLAGSQAIGRRVAVGADQDHHGTFHVSLL